MSIKISGSHPMPDPNKNPKTRKGRKGDGRQMAILNLLVGESFWIPTTISSVCGLRHWARARYPDRDFTAEAGKEDKTDKTDGTGKDGVRIWRTK